MNVRDFYNGEPLNKQGIPKKICVAKIFWEEEKQIEPFLSFALEKDSASEICFDCHIFLWIVIVFTKMGICRSDL